MENLTLDKDKVYIVGVSGGPDSMALFDMCRKQNIQVVGAHMNYQLRDSAKRDMDIVKDYCEQYGITYEVCMQNKQCVGNFQAFARKQRYTFYHELLKKYHGEAVLLAHQMDDHLETYIMQKQSNRYATYFGIQERTRIQECDILRPLLSYTKGELETYCIKNHVPYGIDESNLSDHYERNRIRHTIIEHMSYQEKLDLVARIQEENKQWLAKCAKADAFLASWNYAIEPLKSLTKEFMEQVLIRYIYQFTHVHIPHHEITVLHDLIQGKAKHWTKDITNKYVIYSEYGKLCMDTKETTAYRYQYDKLTFEKTPYFEIAKSGTSVEALTLQESDFPLTIRSFQESDKIQLRFGSKKVSRWFIDRKIPKKERVRWPIVENAQGNVILVPKIGCDIEHFSNNPTCFVVK